MEIAQYTCRVSALVLRANAKRQRLPKIVVGDVQDYRTARREDNDVLLCSWDDGSTTCYNVMKTDDTEFSLKGVEDTFVNGRQIESPELLDVIRELNKCQVFRTDRTMMKFRSNAVQLRIVPTRVTRILVRVGTVDLDENGLTTKLPEVVCDTVESQTKSDR
eukprot:scpid95381/ scgid24869/ 